MTEDYRQGYRDGFEDGMKKSKTDQQSYVCEVCKNDFRASTQLYVCPRGNCPTGSGTWTTFGQTPPVTTLL